MSYHHANVALSQGQINKLKSKQASSSGTSITLKHGQLSGGKNKLSVTQTQLNQIAKPDQQERELDLTLPPQRIFPLLSAIPALIASAAPAVAKAAALGAVGTAAEMAIKKVTGKGYRKRGGFINLSAVSKLISAAAAAIPRALAAAENRGREGNIPISTLARIASALVYAAMPKVSGRGYKKREAV